MAEMNEGCENVRMREGGGWMDLNSLARFSSTILEINFGDRAGNPIPNEWTDVPPIAIEAQTSSLKYPRFIPGPKKDRRPPHRSQKLQLLTQADSGGFELVQDYYPTHSRAK